VAIKAFASWIVMLRPGMRSSAESPTDGYRCAARGLGKHEEPRFHATRCGKRRTESVERGCRSAERWARLLASRTIDESQLGLGKGTRRFF